MTTYPLGWQSWSPPTPHFLHFPTRDYCPVKEIQHSLPLPLPPKPPITYWCSWYALGWQITPVNLLEQAGSIKKNHLPIDYFLIDDGWAYIRT